MDTIAIDTIKSILIRLMAENTPNLNDPTDKYAQGYHDAIVDVMGSIDIPHTEKHYD